MKKAISLGLLGMLTHDTSAFNNFDAYQPYKPASNNVFNAPQPKFTPYNSGRVNTKKQDSPAPQQKRQDIIYGRPGSDGSHGKDGAVGAPGARGVPGPYGKPGAMGEKGDRGYPGNDGKDGVPGKPGSPGKPGKSKSGKPGPKGDTGKRGNNGLDGKNGSNGKPGKPGLAGPKGAAGKPGKNGLQGYPGVKGERGVPGRDGPKGPPGQPGKSRSGVPGPPGPPGPPGDCSCGNKKRRRQSRKKRSIEPVGINTGIGGYGADLFGGYGQQNGKAVPLSGDAYGDDYYYYAPKFNDKTLPKKYNDGYDPKTNANYKISLPDGASVSKLANLGGYGNNNNKKLANRKNIKKNDSAEKKKFIKEKSRDKVSDVILESDIERKRKGYSDNLDYAGAEIYEDAAAAQQKYVKGEAYVSEGDEAYRKDSLYGGDALYQKDDVATNAKVAFEVDHSLKFRNDYNDENHRGSYKGNEFDVAYKASDVQGGYSDTELDREKKAAAYQGVNAQGENNKAGKYYGDDYYKYGKDDKDLYYKDRQFGDVAYDPKNLDGASSYPGASGVDYKPDLYSKFKGDGKGKPVPVYGKGKTSSGRNYYPYGERLYIDQDKEQDDKYRGYGANFEGKDAFLAKKEAEAYAGASEKAREKIAFDKGNYRDVAAKGKNKQASYAGDYQTNKKSQDVDYNVKHYEDLQQDLQQDIKSDQYYAKYEGEDNKFARDAERKSGKYQDAEIKRKQDALINAKRYNGNDFSNKDKVDDEAYIYLHAKKDNAVKQRIKADPKGYRPKPKRSQRPGIDSPDDRRPDGSQRYGVYGRGRDRDTDKKDYKPYGPDMFKNSDYGYYKPKDDYRRRMIVNQEINELQAKISNIKLATITSKSDMLYITFGLVLSGIFGALSFIGLMRLNGYKTKKIIEETEDSEKLLESQETN